MNKTDEVKREQRAFTVAEMQDWNEPIWLLDGIVPYREFGVIYGPPKTGKTFITLSIALHIAMGRSFCGQKCAERGIVTYVAARDGRGNFTNRCAAWLKEHNVTGDELGEWFRMHMSSVDLTQPSEVEAFVKDLADVPRHALIVFDFLAANSGTSDEDAAGMNSVCDGAERISRATGASVILVHHTGEDPSKGPRGDNVLVSRAGILLRVDKMKNNDFLLTVEESRDGPKGKQWCFELVPHVIDDKQNQAMTVRNTPAPHR